ncbi:zinc carboxypeptidase-like [Drosophila tropicalis]|uniref:zinc carboxypeptidase-like n=1 Tax=Drosophila tropicalis TaxID=46794 RepID=UPI0035AC1F03
MKLCEYLFSFSLILAIASASIKVRYDDHAVYRVRFENQQQRQVLQQILGKEEQKYDIWYEGRNEMHVMVNPLEASTFRSLAYMAGLEVEVFIPNVQKLIDDEQPLEERYNSDFNWKRYHNLEEIYAWLDKILIDYANVTEGLVIGQSYEGRDIRAVKISHNTGKPAIFIESTIHAREWITVATATWFINELLTSDNSQVRELAENYDWYIVPVLNVDGFVYTHTNNRLWRKTRQPNANSECIGTDGNRNFDAHWMENGGASDDPCEDRFGGSAPFSEPETKALSEFVANIKDDLRIYLAFHSYSQFLLYPYGHTEEVSPPNKEDLEAIGDVFTSAIKNLVYGTEYKHGTTPSLLYIASGSSVDWAYSEMDIKLAYTIEFRDTGRHGQVLPAAYIIPNSEELLAGLIALIDKAKDLYYI